MIIFWLKTPKKINFKAKKTKQNGLARIGEKRKEETNERRTKNTKWNWDVITIVEFDSKSIFTPRITLKRKLSAERRNQRFKRKKLTNRNLLIQCAIIEFVCWVPTILFFFRDLFICLSPANIFIPSSFGSRFSCHYLSVRQRDITTQKKRRDWN